MQQFFLGTHHPHWLGQVEVPLFVSRRSLAKRRTFPRALGPWALDSGGFTELAMYGRWTLSTPEYVGEVRRFRDEIGQLDFAAPQDWMCEPEIIHGNPKKGLVGTKLSVPEHQRLTIENFLELRALAPEIPWIPVLQGWSLGDYLHHVEDYARAGIDLAAERLVGVGTVCRRQNTTTASTIMTVLAHEGIRIHAFGYKMTGLERSASNIASADSLAWSASGRRNPPLPGHEVRHKNCANCIEYALDWREGALAAIERGQRQQLSLQGVL